MVENFARGWSLSESALTQLAKEALLASRTIYPAVRVTELRKSPWLSSHGNVHLKLENGQETGSFKARGATNKVLSLDLATVNKGIVTCSTGNHALAVLHAVNQLPMLRGPEWVADLTIYLPETVSEAKAGKLRRQGARLVLHGRDSVEAEREARAVADAQGMTYISPYNDLKVAGGQGTIALELLSQLAADELDAVFVPVGGGGLISGIASVLAAVRPRVRTVGCQPVNSCVMLQSVTAGRVLDVPSEDTLSDGTAGGVEEDSITFEPCRTFVDEWITVTEQEIAAAMLGLSNNDSMAVEGSAGVAIASYIKNRQQYAGQSVVLICCGGNISQATMDEAARLVQAGVSS